MLLVLLKRLLFYRQWDQREFNMLKKQRHWMDSANGVMKIGTVRTFVFLLLYCICIPSDLFYMWCRYDKHFSKCLEPLCGFLGFWKGLADCLWFESLYMILYHTVLMHCPDAELPQEYLQRLENSPTTEKSLLTDLLVHEYSIMAVCTRHYIPLMLPLAFSLCCPGCTRAY